MTLLIVFVLLAIGVSFLCSILEAVLLSITPSFVESAAEERPGLAKNLRTLRADIERPLAAILSLNTIAHTVGATGAGAAGAGGAAGVAVPSPPFVAGDWGALDALGAAADLGAERSTGSPPGYVIVQLLTNTS